MTTGACVMPGGAGAGSAEDRDANAKRKGKVKAEIIVVGKDANSNDCFVFRPRQTVQA